MQKIGTRQVLPDNMPISSTTAFKGQSVASIGKEKLLLDGFQKQAEQNIKKQTDNILFKLKYKLKQKLLKYGLVALTGLSIANITGCFDKFYPEKGNIWSCLVDHRTTKGFVPVDLLALFSPLLGLAMLLEPEGLDTLPPFNEYVENLTEEEKKRLAKLSQQDSETQSVYNDKKTRSHYQNTKTASNTRGN